MLCLYNHLFAKIAKTNYLAQIRSSNYASPPVHYQMDIQIGIHSFIIKQIIKCVIQLLVTFACPEWPRSRAARQKSSVRLAVIENIAKTCQQKCM